MPPVDAALRLAFTVALIVTVVMTVIKAYKLVRYQNSVNLPAIAD